MRIQLIVVLTVGFVCIAAVVAGFLLIGSPEHEQRLAADRVRIDDLRSIALAISRNASVPALPPAKVAPTFYGGSGVLTSAVSTAPYPYRRIDARYFELCASFLEPAPDLAQERDRDYPHGAGNACYTFDLRNKSSRPIQKP